MLESPHPSHCFAMGPFPLPLQSAVEGKFASKDRRGAGAGDDSRAPSDIPHAVGPLAEELKTAAGIDAAALAVHLDHDGALDHDRRRFAVMGDGLASGVGAGG